MIKRWNILKHRWPLVAGFKSHVCHFNLPCTNITGLFGLQVTFFQTWHHVILCLVIMTALPWTRKHVKLVSSDNKHHLFCVTSLLQVLIFTMICIIVFFYWFKSWLYWLSIVTDDKKFSEIKMWPIWNLVSSKREIKER